MAAKSVPEGHNSVSPYLIVPGAAQLIEFLKSAFRATELMRSAMPDGSIMHAEVRIGDSVVMIADANEQVPATQANVHVYVPDVDDAYGRAVGAGATSVREPADQFYGDRSAGVKHAGTQWWIATHVEDVSDEEIARRMKAARPDA
ncbi:MAG TPA: VOC family protein [Candidatus Binatia bacterium]|nr:VOC family protein [Candidatus Binatia bacterium]